MRVWPVTYRAPSRRRSPTLPQPEVRTVRVGTRRRSSSLSDILRPADDRSAYLGRGGGGINVLDRDVGPPPGRVVGLPDRRDIVPVEACDQVAASPVHRRHLGGLPAEQAVVERVAHVGLLGVHPARHAGRITAGWIVGHVLIVLSVADNTLIRAGQAVESGIARSTYG